MEAGFELAERSTARFRQDKSAGVNVYFGVRNPKWRTHEDAEASASSTAPAEVS